MDGFQIVHEHAVEDQTIGAMLLCSSEHQAGTVQKLSRQPGRELKSHTQGNYLIHAVVAAFLPAKSRNRSDGDSGAFLQIFFRNARLCHQDSEGFREGIRQRIQYACHVFQLFPGREVASFLGKGDVPFSAV